MKLPFRRLVGVARDTRGAQVAEFAAVLPLLIMILLGIMWFGRALNIYTTLHRAARAAAQASAIHSCATCGNTLPADVQTSVVNPILTVARLDPGQVQGFGIDRVVMSSTSTPQINGFEAHLSYPYTFKLNGLTCCPPALTPIVLGVTITARSQAREER